jgi:hypothetical protein
MEQLENMKLSEMKQLLKWLREYSDLTKKLGRRWRDLFFRHLTGKNSYVVEYYPSYWEDAAWSQAQLIFQKSFSLFPEKNDVVFLWKQEVKGGMKIYVNDSLVDMSFDAVEKKLQK